MKRYKIRYVHKISPSEKDCIEVNLPDAAFADKRALAAALRRVAVLISGTRLSGMRVKDNECVAFPAGSIWHSLIITKVES